MKVISFMLLVMPYATAQRMLGGPIPWRFDPAGGCIHCPCSCEVSCSDSDAKWRAVENRVCNGVKCGCDIDLDNDFKRTVCDPVTNMRTPTPKSLSNCVLLEISREGAIDIGSLDNVKIKRIVASGRDADNKGHDVDFEGVVRESLICDTQSTEGDLEFGGSHCPAKVTDSVFESVTVGKDFKFEEGTVVTGNKFGTVTAAKQFELTDEDDFNGHSDVKHNTFALLTVKECKDRIPGMSRAFHCNTVEVAAGNRDDCGRGIFITGFEGLDE